MPRNSLQWGDWNAICDVCGMKHKASQMKKRWDGLMVCPQDWESRHPQDFLKVRPDSPSVPWSRPEPADVFVPVCFIWGSSAYAGLAEAGCAKVGYTPFSYTYLFNLKYNNQDPSLNPAARMGAIPAYAIPGYAIPSEYFTGY